MYSRGFFILLVVVQIALVVGFYPRIISAIQYKSSELTYQNDESIRLIKAKGVDIPPSVEVTTNRVSGQVCREIGNFAERKSAEGVRQWLEARGAGGRIDTKVTISKQSFRVYVGEFAEEEEAAFAQSVIQQRNANLNGAFIYRSNKNWRVSLGQFAQESNAEAFKKELEDQVEGLRIFIESRQQTTTSSTLRYVGKDAEKVAQLEDNEEFGVQIHANSVRIKDCS